MKKSPFLILPTLPSLVALLLATVAPVQAETEDRIEKAFQISGDGRLVVDADLGTIEVRGTRDSRVSVEVTRMAKAKSKTREQALLDEHDLQFEQQGNEVLVRARRKEGKGRGWNLRNETYRVKFVIEIPETLATDLKTSGGGISVDNVKRAVKARTSGGGLKFSRVEANLDGKTSGGGIELNRCSGNVRVETSGGGIRAVECSGDLVLSTSGGGIDLDRIQGHVDGTTSGGSIEASILSAPSQDSRLSTSGGGIVVNIDAQAAFDLDAGTSGGSVRSDLPVTIQGEHHNSSLRGRVNGGGKVLKLQSSGGSIHVKKLAT